jgi:hypothetical protein
VVWIFILNSEKYIGKVFIHHPFDQEYIFPLKARKGGGERGGEWRGGEGGHFYDLLNLFI